MPRSYGPYCVRCGKVAHVRLTCVCEEIVCCELCLEKHLKPTCAAVGLQREQERQAREREAAARHQRWLAEQERLEQQDLADELRRRRDAADRNKLSWVIAAVVLLCTLGPMMLCGLIVGLSGPGPSRSNTARLAGGDPDDWRPAPRTGKVDDSPPRTDRTLRTEPDTHHRTEPSATTPRTDPMLPGERTDRTERTGRTTGPIVGPIDDPRTGRTRPVPAATPIAPADLAERHDRQQVTVRGKVADVDARTAFTFEGGLVCTLGAGSTDGLKPGQVVTVTGTCYIVQGKPKLGRCDIVTRD